MMTLGLVLGTPDGAAILASGCREYHRKLLDHAGNEAILAAIGAGRAQQVFALQRHGLEHCWPNALLARAREDAALQSWLADPLARTETLPADLQSRWTDASRLPSMALARADIEAAVNEEAAKFQGDLRFRARGGGAQHLRGPPPSSGPGLQAVCATL